MDTNDLLYRLKLIITGVGRCGTSFMARYVNSTGFPCGHERFFDWHGYEFALTRLRTYWRGTTGESSWCAAPFLDRPVLKDALLVHLIRHPRDYIGSMLKIWPIYSDHTDYTRFAAECVPELNNWDQDRVTWSALRWLRWNEMLERAKDARNDCITFNIEGEPVELLHRLQKRGLIGEADEGALFDDRKDNTLVKAAPYPVRLQDIDESVRVPLLELAAKYGYEWEETIHIWASSPPVIKAVITTLDNQPNNVEQLEVLRQEPIQEIVFVNNGSVDNTREWLDQQDGITAIHRENLGAGPGRNAGIDAAGQFDYLLTLDGGIRPLRGGTIKLLEYLDRHNEADVLGIEIKDFETDYDKAWRRWPAGFSCEGHIYHNSRLSHTAYALSRARAWDGLRFCEDGPFGQPGWGADDDEMAYRWADAGIRVAVLTCACNNNRPCSGVHPYRRASGSFRRLEKETGIWPTDYGSVYERRVLWMEHNWPQYEPGDQWGEPYLTLVIQADPSIGTTAKRIKLAHDLLRKRTFTKPWHSRPNPYSVVLWMIEENRGTVEWSRTRHQLYEWAQERHLRRHQGTRAIHNGSIIQRTRENEETWTGDFRIWPHKEWKDAVRPNAYYYALAKTYQDVIDIIERYNVLHPPQPVKNPPQEKREICLP